MTATRLAAALALGSVLGISCYSEPLPPSTYRFACESDSECHSNEVCRLGRCELPCTTIQLASAGLLGVDLPCPIGTNGIAGCYNGACASACLLGSDNCTKDQTCLDVGLGSLGGGGLGGGSTSPTGVCTFECDPNDPNDSVCPTGEACNDEGVCGPIDCSGGQACPDTDTCFFGYCMPSCAAGLQCPQDFSCLAAFGVCGQDCSPACASDEACFFGTCAPDCDADPTVCEDGQLCIPGIGVCISTEVFSTTTTGSTSDAGGAGDSGTSGTTAMGVELDDEERR